MEKENISTLHVIHILLNYDAIKQVQFENGSNRPLITPLQAATNLSCYFDIDKEPDAVRFTTKLIADDNGIENILQITPVYSNN